MKGMNLRLKFGAIFYKKKRLFLSVLGIVIGVAAVVVMISVGEGAKEKVMREFETFSPDTLTVVAGKTRIRGGRAITVRRYTTLKMEDAEAVKKILGVVRVAPVYEGSVTVEYERETITCTLVGSTPEIFKIRRFSLLEGRIFTQREAYRNGKVAVIGYRVWKELFKDEDPIGKRIRIRKLPFVVVGLMKKMGTDASGRDLDSQVIIPISSATNRVFNVDYISAIFVQTAGEAFLNDVSTNIERILMERHEIRNPQDKDFSIVRAEEILKGKAQSAMIFSVFIVSIAAISLLVGAFGVMAVMILSVKERRKEIGLRKALGATKKDIVLQFLGESMAITMFGGFLGVVAGFLLSLLVCALAKYPFVNPAKPSAVAFAVTFFFGVVSGVYPALKASQIDPIATLRD